MLVVCKECNASYAVPATKIGSTGRDVRCAKCNSIFYVEANPEAYKAAIDIENLADEIRNNKSLSEVQDKNLSFMDDNSSYYKDESFFFTKLFTLILLIVTLSMSGIIYYDQLKKVKFISKIYDKFGFHDSDKIALQNLSIESYTDEDNENIRIKGSITNNNDHRVFVPSLRISVKDASGKELLGYIMENKNDTLLPGEKYSLDNIITNLTPDAHIIVLDIGNQIELLLR